MIAIERNRPPRLVASISGTKFPQSRSGRAVIVELNDTEVNQLESGDVVLWQDYDGPRAYGSLRALEVLGVRQGVAWEDGQQRPYDVPVINGRVLGTERVFVVAGPDLLWWQESDTPTPPASYLSAQNFAAWASHKGHKIKPVGDSAEYDR